MKILKNIQILFVLRIMSLVAPSFNGNWFSPFLAILYKNIASAYRAYFSVILVWTLCLIYINNIRMLMEYTV